MPYCPVCKQEFEDFVRECPDDEAALVPELPAPVTEGSAWMEIATIGTAEEAKLLQGFLEAEGIHASIENLKFTMEPVNFGSMSEIRVYVGAQDQQRALALLRQREREYKRLNEQGHALVTDEGPVEVDESVPPESE